MYEKIGIADKKSEVKSQNLVPQIRRKSESSQSMNSPVDRILFLQRTIGNQAVARLIKSGELQAKLRIGQPGDIYEQEADRVAEQVMRMPDVSEAKDTRAQRKCPKCLKGLTRLLGNDNKEKKLQAKETHDKTAEVTPQIETNINALKGGGQPLPESTRTFYEERFGHDFSQVRVHSGADAKRSAREVNANAYTIGHDIVFGEGCFAPGTQDGRRLIGHELTHVVQQSRADENRVVGSPHGDPNFLSILYTPISISRDSEAERIAKLEADYVDALKKQNWTRAAELLNGYSPTAIEKELRQLTHDQLIEMYAGALEGVGWGKIASVSNPIAGLDPEAARVGQLTYDYNSAVKTSRWEDAAKVLAIFNETDIRLKVGKLSTPQLLDLKAGAIKAMPGKSDRVVNQIDDMLTAPSTPRLNPDYEAQRLEAVNIVRNECSNIKGEAKGKNITSEAIAGAILWEAIENPYKRTFSRLGPGKVHPTELLGKSEAERVEEESRVAPPASGTEERTNRLRQPRWAITYIAAIMRRHADNYRNIAGVDISSNTGVLCTLYQGGNSEERARRLAERRRDPNVQPMTADTMGPWVVRNIDFIRGLLVCP